MIILKERIDKDDLKNIEEVTFFNDIYMVKAVVDIKLELIAVNA